MTTKTLLHTLRRVALCACLAFALVAVPARADNPPKVSDPDATAYLQKLSDQIDSLLKAVQDKDQAKTKELGDKVSTTMKDGDAIISKLPQEDQGKAGEWVTGQYKKLIDAGFTPPQ